MLGAVQGFHAALPRRLHGARPARPSRSFQQLIDDSPALQAARREMFARYENELAVVLTEETGAAPDAIEPFVVAVALVGVLRAGFERGTNHTNPAAVQAELSRRATRAFELLDKGLANYGR